MNAVNKTVRTTVSKNTKETYNFIVMFISQESCGASWIYETSMSPSVWLCRSSVDSGTAPLRRIHTLDAWIATAYACRPYCTGGTGTAYPGSQTKRYLDSKQAWQIILTFYKHAWQIILTFYLGITGLIIKTYFYFLVNLECT